MFRMERVIIGYVGGGGGEEVFVSRSQYGHKWQLVEISTTCFVGEKKKKSEALFLHFARHKKGKLRTNSVIDV